MLAKILISILCLGLVGCESRLKVHINSDMSEDTLIGKYAHHKLGPVGLIIGNTNIIDEYKITYKDECGKINETDWKYSEIEKVTITNEN